MKAIVCEQYGAPDTLQLREVDKPTPKEDEALVKIHASSLNAADLETLRGTWIARLGAPLRPMYKILGLDMAGRIEAVGSKVKQFQPGDEIWGDLSYPLGYGGFAEYVCVPENGLRLKPNSMTFEEAAAYPHAAVVALQSLRESLLGIRPEYNRPIQAGQKVLINGAGGSIGTFAIQLAKHFGAEVTAVDSKMKFDKLRSIGADHVIDYTREDYTKNEPKYDRIVDVVAHRTIFAYRRALNSKGIFVYVGGSMTSMLQGVILGPLISRIGSKKMGVNTWNPNKKEDLVLLGELFKAGKVVPIIDRRYTLSEVPEALQYLESGTHLGKIIITVANNSNT
jgi:NADPH:quinone reductase-like Zn-dependent oxidoreductase